MTWHRAANAAVTILALLLVAVPAQAADEGRTPDIRPGQARMEGRPIDLQRGWGDARACVVWDRDDPADCFRTEQAADAAVRRRERAEAREAAATTPRTASTATTTSPRAFDRWLTSVADGTCPDWFTVYDGVGRTGRSLRFRDRGYWQDLGAYGFAGQTSSYVTGACSVDLADAGWAGYPGYTGAYYAAWSMSSGWNDRVRFLRIN